MTRVRLEPRQRRAWILDEAVNIANRDGLMKTTVMTVADRAGFAPATVRYYFNKNSDLWECILAHPKASAPVIAEGHKIGLR
jgi:AcrR family transcriptional regulator